VRLAPSKGLQRVAAGAAIKRAMKQAVRHPFGCECAECKAERATEATKFAKRKAKP
jgi:hypothetical protein